MDDIAFHFFCRNGIKNIFSHPNKIGSDNKKQKTLPLLMTSAVTSFFKWPPKLPLNSYISETEY